MFSMQPSAIPFPLNASSFAVTIFAVALIVYSMRRIVSYTEMKLAGPRAGTMKRLGRSTLLRLEAGIWLVWEGLHQGMMWAREARRNASRGSQAAVGLASPDHDVELGNIENPAVRLAGMPAVRIRDHRLQ